MGIPADKTLVRFNVPNPLVQRFLGYLFKVRLFLTVELIDKLFQRYKCLIFNPYHHTSIIIVSSTIAVTQKKRHLRVKLGKAFKLRCGRKLAGSSAIEESVAKETPEVSIQFKKQPVLDEINAIRHARHGLCHRLYLAIRVGITNVAV